MNLKQINEFRIAHGLTPLSGDPQKAAKKRRQDANRAKREAENQRIHDARMRGGK